MYSRTGRRVTELQGQIPLSDFLAYSPQRVPGLSPTQRRAIAQVPTLSTLGARRVTGAGIENAPALLAAQRAFEGTVAPQLIGEATLSGLGRSTAVPQALALAQSQFLPGLIESELGREERGIERELGSRLSEIQAGLGAGEVERGVEQEESAAQQAERLRRQAIAEQALFMPFGQLIPSALGQRSTTQTSGGGLFK